MKNLTPASQLSVSCPICEVAAGDPCVFDSGVRRLEPHLDRKLSAANAMEMKRTQRTKRAVKPLSLRLTELFETTGEDRLSLQVLFEVAGSSVKERLCVIETIDQLVCTGMLDACGDELYALTVKAKVASLAQRVAAGHRLI